MKLLKLIPVLFILFMSCDLEQTQYKIEVTYENGDKEIINCSSVPYPWMDEGCVVCNHREIACDVRTYKIN